MQSSLAEIPIKSYQLKFKHARAEVGEMKNVHSHRLISVLLLTGNTWDTLKIRTTKGTI